MTFDRDRILSEFIDAWNAGSRPDVDDYIARAPAEQQGELADQLLSFLTFAPTPSYDDGTLAAIRAEPIVAAALAAPAQRGGLLPSLLTSLRERFSMTTPQLASQLVDALGLPDDRQPKTASYLERLEQGDLEPARISRRVFDALARVFEIPRSQLEGAGDLSRWLPAPAPAAAPVFRADKDAAQAVGAHLDVLADALQAPGGAGRDEVDDLFLGGR